jgi:hypothetical protein
MSGLSCTALTARCREKGNSVFVDDQLQPYEEQWAFLSSIGGLTPEKTQTLLRNVYPAGDVVNVRHGATDYNRVSDPWILPPSGRIADKANTKPCRQTYQSNLET